MKPIVIKVCQSNESAKYEHQLLEMVENHENVQLVIEKCLNRCSFCEDTPYVLINNGIEFGDTIEELMENIADRIANNRK